MKNKDYVGKKVPDKQPTEVGPEKGVILYSTLLQKPFNTLEELKAAEKKYNDAHALELRAKEQKKADAKRVEEVYLNYQKVKRDALESIRKAEEEYLKAREEFCTKHNCGYHMTYSNDNGKETISFGDILDSVFNW